VFIMYFVAIYYCASKKFEGFLQCNIRVFLVQCSKGFGQYDTYLGVLYHVVMLIGIKILCEFMQ
jgi:hypothetical protein